MIYKTAAPWLHSVQAVPPTNGEWVNPHGYYLVGERHAYIDGTGSTLCGLPLTGLIFWSALDWRDGGNFPPRCGTCSGSAMP